MHKFITYFKDKIFHPFSTEEFEKLAIELFHFQLEYNGVYKKFSKLLGVDNPQSIQEIPFLPIELFKTEKILIDGSAPKFTFHSSGTGNGTRSKHFIIDIDIYKKALLTSFNIHIGDPTEYCILALCPSYINNPNSSLAFMLNELIKKSKNNRSGFYLNKINDLQRVLLEVERKNQKTIVFGLSFALLDFIEEHRFRLKHTIIMETGGTKGKREEITKQELHKRLMLGFGVDRIYSEYGMAELLSQAYSKSKGLFKTPGWMKILVRDITDPFTYVRDGKTGLINIIDFSNLHSCPFIATQDLGCLESSKFKVLGRFKKSEARGCNLLLGV